MNFKINIFSRWLNKFTEHINELLTVQNPDAEICTGLACTCETKSCTWNKKYFKSITSRLLIIAERESKSTTLHTLNRVMQPARHARAAESLISYLQALCYLRNNYYYF
jgi:hypothetical protein